MQYVLDFRRRALAGSLWSGLSLLVSWLTLVH